MAGDDLRAVLFDVDFTLARPRPELGPDGYIRAGRRASRSHGKVKPDPTIFQAALDLLGVSASEAAMVGDQPEDDVAGARAVGIRAFLLDREDRFREVEGRLPNLFALPAALGLDRVV